MGTAVKKPRAKRSVKSGIKNFIRTHKNLTIINRLIKELQSKK
jgi:hypothetical protein